MSNFPENFKQSLEVNGYCLFKNVISDRTVDLARAAYQRMLCKIEAGGYPFFRIYDNYWLLNIAGIEHIFHPDIFEPDLFAAVVESGLLPKAMGLLGTTTPVMLLNRIHCTTHYSHTGIWHRDADACTEPHLQMALFLFDEDRFFVVPGSHQRELSTEENHLLSVSRMACLPNQMTIGGQAGDLMFFNSSILHRGSCIQQRAHVHFRIGKGDPQIPFQSECREEFGRREVLDLCDEHWEKMFTCNMYDSQDSRKSVCGSSSNSSRGILKRLMATFLHHVLFFIPESSPLFSRLQWAAPNLRLQKVFGLWRKKV